MPKNLTSDETLEEYHCLYCGRCIEADEDGLFVHDDVPHPENETYDEDRNPQ